MMKTHACLCAFFVAAAAPVLAAGLDRSGQGLGALFDDGNRIEFSYARSMPRVDGRDRLGGATGDVTRDHALTSFSAKYALDDRLSLALVIDQPYGGKLEYGEASPMLGGTRVDQVSHAVLGLVRYRFDEHFSVHGGARLLQSSATIDLKGLAYGPVNGYRVRFEADTAPGFVAGVAYEIPAIALRVAATYHQRVRHKLETTETGPNIDPDGAGPLPAMPLLNARSTTAVGMPRALNLDFQTGIAADTLLFGQLRWVDWSEFRVDPVRILAVTGEGLVDMQDSRTYTLGVARKFSTQWAGVLSFNYEPECEGFNSPLSPVNGRRGITLAAIHSWDKYQLTVGLSYIKLGDAKLETGTPDTQRATMTDNSAIGLGMKLGYRF